MSEFDDKENRSKSGSLRNPAAHHQAPPELAKNNSSPAGIAAPSNRPQTGAWLPAQGHHASQTPSQTMPQSEAWPPSPQQPTQAPLNVQPQGGAGSPPVGQPVQTHQTIQNQGRALPTALGHPTQANPYAQPQGGDWPSSPAHTTQALSPAQPQGGGWPPSPGQPTQVPSQAQPQGGGWPPSPGQPTQAPSHVQPQGEGWPPPPGQPAQTPSYAKPQGEGWPPSPGHPTQTMNARPQEGGWPPSPGQPVQTRSSAYPQGGVWPPPPGQPAQNTSASVPGASSLDPGRQTRPPLHKGVSTYLGAASAEPGLAAMGGARLVEKFQVNSTIPSNTAPSLVVAEIERARAEEQRLRDEKFASLNFGQRLTLAFATTWSYKSNFFWSSLVLLGLLFLIYRNVFKYSQLFFSNVVLGVLVLASMTFFSYMLFLGFTNLVSKIIDDGEPNSTFETIFDPWTKLSKLAGPLAVLIVIQSIILWCCVIMAAISTFGGYLALALQVCLIPLNFCYLLYFTETEDFSTIDGLVEPLKMFAENIGGWLSVIFCVIISLGAMTLIMLALAVVAAYVIIIGPLLWFLTYIFLLFFVSVFITCYACYVSKQNIIARSLSE